MRIVMLPGMDGTGALFAPFQAAAPPEMSLTVVPLPAASSDYAALATELEARVELGPDAVLLAESFAGPLALRLAARRAPAAVILVNSFVHPPLPAAWCRLAPSALFALPAPDAVLRHWLLGPTASATLLAAFRTALRQVPARVLAARVRALATVDATADVARLACPLLYLRGTDDRLVSDRSLGAFTDAAPGAPICRLPGPHLLLQAAPHEAWAVLSPFLARWAAA